MLRDLFDCSKDELLDNSSSFLFFLLNSASEMKRFSLFYPVLLPAVKGFSFNNLHMLS